MVATDDPGVKGDSSPPNRLKNAIVIKCSAGNREANFNAVDGKSAM